MKRLSTPFVAIALVPFVGLLVLASRNANADDLKTNSGYVYRDVVIKGVDADGLRIFYADGAVKVPFEELPKSVQEKYGYDAVAVAAKKRAAEQARLAEAKRLADARFATEMRLRQEAEAQRAATAEQYAREQQVQQQALLARQASEQAAERARQASEQARRDEQLVASVVYFFAIVALFIVGIWFYFLPSIIGRRKRNALAIFVLNLGAGWTFAGWVIALVWACTKDSAVELAFEEKQKSKMAAKEDSIETMKIVLPRRRQ